MAVARKSTEIEVPEIGTPRVSLVVVGTEPLICNRMSEKAKHELLMPKGRKTTADKAAAPKHDPLAEFAASPYTIARDDCETYLGLMATSFKRAMGTAATYVGGTNKVSVERLVWVHPDDQLYVRIWGIPQVLMSVVRSADMKKTPDVRTRAIIPKWCAELVIGYVDPPVTAPNLVRLLAMGGLVAGVGDWRPKKGSGTLGQFRVAPDDDAEYRTIRKTGGRAAQMRAMAEPSFYNLETAELYEWFMADAASRGVRHTLKAVQ